MLTDLMDSFKNVPDAVKFNQDRQDLIDLKAAVAVKRKQYLLNQAVAYDKQLTKAEEEGEKKKKAKVQCQKSPQCSRENRHAGVCNKDFA